MKIGFYARLARDGIKKNKKLYLPYLITSALMIAIFYIIFYLSTCASLKYMRGGASLQMIITLGVFVIGVFSALFLFYTNSFLIKRRKKEFGLYNILGMDKHGISKVLFWESIYVYALSMLVGSAGGIMLSKLFEAGLTHMIAGVVDYDFSINFSGIFIAAIAFGCFYLLIFLNAVRQVRFSNVIDLVKSTNVGEKAPKANWVLGIVGLGILGYAYYLAVSIANPISALLYFFVAAIMVIVATYILLIAGSVVFCKLLQKNKNYYYQKSHFVSVSSMMYRMKRNGAGLASICILLTMILVTISSTTCLYIGTESNLKESYPRQIVFETYFNSIDEMYSYIDDNPIVGEVEKICKANGTECKNIMSAVSCVASGSIDSKGVVKIFPTQENESFDRLIYVTFMSLDEYNKSSGKTLELNEGEAYIWSEKSKVDFSEISFLETGDCFKIKGAVDPIEEKNQKALKYMLDDVTLVIDNFSESLKVMEKTKAINPNNDYEMSALQMSWKFGFDTDLNPDEEIGLKNQVYNYLHEECSKEECPVERFTIDAIEEERQDFYGTFAGFFFLGLMLSFVFLIAAVLIIYYKQITEGYEDQPRFVIMQKVGMTKKDIKKSINSQMLTVFYLPLAFAALHMAFAFPMVSKLLMMFGLTDIMLFAITTAATTLVIALIYAVVYKITSSIYYNLVSSVNMD
ncbi:MAG: ABC transporter permease [Lachnospiraceae bacterium]|nr:ABC transporter permease [Lachnospiraceae bacterium]